MDESEKDARAAKIAEVIRRLQLLHGRNTTGLNIEPDKRIGTNRWSCTRFCSDPIEEWTCPLCMKEYNGYGGTVVVPCWTCRDVRSIESFGDLHQENMPEPMWSRTATEQELFDAICNQDRKRSLDARLAGELAKVDGEFYELRASGGASIRAIKSIKKRRQRILDNYEGYDFDAKK